MGNYLFFITDKKNLVFFSANFQQQFTDGYSESEKSEFDKDILKLNFTEFTYQMNNIST